MSDFGLTAAAPTYGEEELKELAAVFIAFEAPYITDPFKKLHHGALAAWLEGGKACLLVDRDRAGAVRYAAVLKHTQRARGLADFTGEEVATIARGELEVMACCFRTDTLADLCRALQRQAPRGLWLTRVAMAQPLNAKLVATLGATHVSSRISGTGQGDVWGLYYAGPRTLTPLPAVQQVNFARMRKVHDVRKEAAYLQAPDVGYEVTERGQRYGGPAKTWRRICIREANQAAQDRGALAAHPVFTACPRLLTLMERLAPCEQLDAVMLTRVAPAGLIARHTDIALDKQGTITRFGHGPGKTLRLHVVLQAGPQTRFSIWDLTGREQQVVMEAGSVWYADIRKSHAVANPGSTARIHLVLDYWWSQALWDQLTPVC